MGRAHLAGHRHQLLGCRIIGLVPIGRVYNLSRCVGIGLADHSHLCWSLVYLFISLNGKEHPNLGRDRYFNRR